MTDAERKVLGLSYRSSLRVKHDPADGGKTAHCEVRWVSRHGELDPWSETGATTIPA